MMMSENDDLKKKVEKLLLENERLKNRSGAVRFEELYQEKMKLKKDVRILRDRTDDLELECAAYLALKRELRKKEKELTELRSILNHRGKNTRKPVARAPKPSYGTAKKNYNRRPIHNSVSKNNLRRNNQN